MIVLIHMWGRSGFLIIFKVSTWFFIYGHLSSITKIHWLYGPQKIPIGTKIYLGKNFEICPKKLGLKCKYERTFISLTSWSTHPAWFSLLFSFSKRSALIVPRYFSWRVNHISFFKKVWYFTKKVSIHLQNSKKVNKKAKKW